MFTQIWQMRRSTCVLGCRRPMATGCPGSVTSSRSAASAAACAAATSVVAPGVDRRLHPLLDLVGQLARQPGAPPASSPPRPRRIAAREPFRPRYRTRTASSADTSAAAARSAWAAGFQARLGPAQVTHPSPTKKERPE